MPLSRRNCRNTLAFVFLLAGALTSSSPAADSGSPSVSASTSTSTSAAADTASASVTSASPANASASPSGSTDGVSTSGSTSLGESQPAQSASGSGSSAAASGSGSGSAGRRSHREWATSDVDTNTATAKAALLPVNGPSPATRQETKSSDVADPVPPPPATDTFAPATQAAATASPVAQGGPTPLAPGEKPLTLAECFRLAAIRSDTLKITAQDVLIAKTQWSQAAAGLFPTVSLVNSESFQNQVRNGTAARLSVSGAAGRDYGSSTGIGATQTIFNGAQNYNAVGAASQTIEAKRQTLRYGYQTLYQDTATAFYQMLIDAGQVSILTDLVHDFESRVTELQRRVRLGRSRPADLLLAQADLASGRVSLEQEKALLNVDREMMAFLIGIPAGKIFLRDEAALPTAANIEAYLRDINFRPDLLSQLATIRATERDLSSAKGALWPTITGDFNWTPLNDPKNTQQWTATFNVSLPIFDGGLIIGRINEQRELLRQSQFSLESLQRTGDQQVRSAYANFNGSAAQYLQNRQYAELSAMNYNAQLDDYRHGVSANLDVLTALQSYHSARQQLHVADMNTRLNFIKLHVAAGNAPTGSDAVTTVTSAPIPSAGKTMAP
ncbi:TolC family protein [Verrucomicrobium sp. GAS474]|uniref:TolC family protein n=1 Tax=Verrucomicrobium sp. GAS474 TaxID=1882831 RepID=UPI0013906BC6|nr:TolC family protein [Verrucomicrobium sp. GAS474]